MKYSERYLSNFIKNTVFIFILIMALPAISQQGEDDVRTDKTKIADLLMQLPAQSSTELERIMGELFQFGGKMITDFATQLVPPGEGDDSRLRYAISGMAKYASSGDDEEHRIICSEALCDALALTKYDEVNFKSHSANDALLKPQSQQPYTGGGPPTNM